ncbi:MAG TPA: hypothetical protein VKQ52_21580 [Puia sp.]|nr:hypothetical protein [Puia sp.]
MARETGAFGRVSVTSEGIRREISFVAVVSDLVIFTACRTEIETISITNTSPVRVFPFMVKLDLGLFYGIEINTLILVFRERNLRPLSLKRKIIPLYFPRKVEIGQFLSDFYMSFFHFATLYNHFTIIYI